MAAISIRPAVQTDHRFIEDTMIATLRDNSAFCKGLHPATLSALVDPVLATYQTLVATPTEDSDTILGFLVYQDHETVAFMYVRMQFRRSGVAKQLLARAGISRGGYGSNAQPSEIACAFMITKMDGLRGRAFAAIAESKGYRLRFRPYLPLEATARVIYGDAEKAAR